MKKEKIKRYDETNFKKSPMYKKHVRKRRKEKICRFVSLPTFLWTIAFLIISSLLLLVSFFINQITPWCSGVLVSIACGIITGVILYFLSNLRNNKQHSLQINQDNIYTAYKLVCDIIFEKIALDSSRNSCAYCCTVEDETKSIMEKIGDIREAFYVGDIGCCEDVEELNLLENEIDDFWKKYDFLFNDNDRQKWIDSVIEFLTDEKAKLEFLMEKNSDKIRFIKKYIF